MTWEAARLTDDVLGRALDRLFDPGFVVGNLERAEPTLREAADRLSSKLGPDHPDVGGSLASLGEVLRQQKKFAESETTLLRAAAILVESKGEADPVAQWTMQKLVKLYSDWGKPAQAAEWSAKLTEAG